MLRLPTRIPITLPGVRTAIGISAPKQGGGISPAVFLPAGLNWDLVNYPIAPTITDPGGLAPATGDAGITPEAMFDRFSVARSAPTKTYYIGPGGVDANDGLTYNTRKLSWSSALTAGNASGGAFKLVPDAGEYPRNLGPNGVLPTQDVAIVPAAGGVATIGTFDLFGTMALDATYTNCYKLAIGAADRITNRLSQNSYGDDVDYLFYPSATALNTATFTQDGAFHDGTNIYMRRLDGLAPTPTNTRYLRSAVALWKVTADISTYIENVEGLGGQVATFEYTQTVVRNTTRRAVVYKNSKARYNGGTAGTAGRGFSTDSAFGIAYLYGCTGNACGTDGINFHDAMLNGQHSLTVNCIGKDNGRNAQESSNGHTAHDDCRSIDLAGLYVGNHGGSCSYVANSKTLLAGTSSSDLGSFSTGIKTSFQIDNNGGTTAELWCDRTKDLGPAGGNGYLAVGTGALHRRNVATGLGSIGGSGVNDTY